MAPRKPHGHRWARVGYYCRPSWILARLGPGEAELVRGRTLAGHSFECDRCGCARMDAEVLHVDEEGDRHWRTVTLYGWHWDALTPMRAAPACAVFARPDAGAPEELDGAVDPAQLALAFNPGAAA